MYSLVLLRRTRNIVKIIERETVAVIKMGIDHTLLPASAEKLGGFGAWGLQPMICSRSNSSGGISLSMGR